jgi:hypothetical protein
VCGSTGATTTNPHLLAQRLDAIWSPSVDDQWSHGHRWTGIELQLGTLSPTGPADSSSHFDDTRSVSADLYVQSDSTRPAGSSAGPLAYLSACCPITSSTPTASRLAPRRGNLAWDRDDRNGQFQEPFAQRIDHDGAPVWPLNGVAVVGDQQCGAGLDR